MVAVMWVLGGVALGGALAFFGVQSWMRRKSDGAMVAAEKIVAHAKLEAEQALAEAQKKSAQVLEDARKEEQVRREELRAKEQRVDQRESMFDKRFGELDEQQKAMELEKERLRGIKAKLETMEGERQAKLQEVAGLTREQAVERLLADVQVAEKDALESRLHKMEQTAEDTLLQKANKMLALTIERLASSVAVETTTSMVELPSDEMKGRIIGKEGRNIKAIELLTGTEIVVDDTPQAVTVSSFSPVRRQVAKRAMETLMKDGRIQPARIEEAVEQAKKELAMEMKKAGEAALMELGIPVSSIDPKLVQILGRLKFRTSYGQNQLQHAMEVAQLSAMLAEELKADVALCKKGGLFHDIGKAVDHDMQGSHPEIGYNIMKKFGFPEEIAYQSIGHHVDKPKTLEAVIIKTADAISGARPGARKNSLEQYVQRLEELEKTASNFAGVERVYALQAGREIRVFVRPNEVDDFAMYSMAKGIAQKIESDLQYPGEIKVTMIRENRVVEYAR